MASWKKVIVSGSGISQLTNDAGYVASVGGGLLSSSAEGGAQGQIKLNGIDVDVQGMGIADSPTFAAVTASTFIGNLSGTADTASYVALANIDGEIVSTTASYVAAAYSAISASNGEITITDMAGNDDVITINNTVQADSASYVAFDDVESLTTFSASVASQITDTAFDLTFAADGGTADVIDDGDTVTFAGGTNITSAVTAGNIEFALDSNISLTGVTASLVGNVVGNVTGDVTGDLTGNADTATALETARTIGGTSFDGTANIVPDTANTASYVDIANVDGDFNSAVAMGGDVTGSAANSTVTAIQNVDITATEAGHVAEMNQDVATTSNVTFATASITANLSVGGNAVITGDLTVNGTTTTVDTDNLNVRDQFINLNDGGGANDGGLVVEGAGTSFGWDQSEGRWAFAYTGATATQLTISKDAFAAAVVTSDDSNYQKVGNIRLDDEDIYIYS